MHLPLGNARSRLGWASLGVTFAWLSLAAPGLAQISPEAELATLKATDGMAVSLYASEPMITNPAAIDIDTHGRVWVAEIQWYRAGAKTPGSDKIKVLEDTDGDGRADKVTVFADDLFAPMSICVAGPRVYVATSPDLWVYEDRDGDLRADGPPQKLLTGFGGRNHDHGAHSLVLGPDHKWWMSHGDQGFDVTGSDGSRVAYQWGAVLRGELDGSQLEIVAKNFRNPYEVCVSSFGEAFLSDNDNDGNESARICWILDGGNYGWFGGPPFGKQELAARLSPNTPFREHWHFRGFMPGYVPATLVTGFGSPTGICLYEGDAFGPKYKNAPLHTDAGPRVCRVYRHEPDGFGMRATSEDFLTNDGDNYFRPDDICAAPDGSLYVSDWYDGGVGGHGYNNPDQGRIFRLTPVGKKLSRIEKPGPYATVADALQALKSCNLATQFLARERLLAEGEKSVAALRALLDDPEPNARARALWLLDRLGGKSRDSVLRQLDNTDPIFRSLAVRILRRHRGEYADVILAAPRDKSPLVRREVLLALTSMEGEQADAALARLADEYDGHDRYLLEVINLAAEGRRDALLARLEAKRPLGPERFQLLQILNPERAAEQLIAELAATPTDTKNAALVIDRAANLPGLAAGWSVLKLAENPNTPIELRRLALKKIVGNAGHRGNWSALADDAQLAERLRALLGDEQVRPDVLRAAATLRLVSLGPDVLTMARNDNVADGVRVTAIDVAARLKPAGAAAAFASLIKHGHAPVSRAAISGLAEVGDARTVREIFTTPQLPSDTKRALAKALAESNTGAIVLLRLIDERMLPDELQAFVIRKGAVHPDSNVRVLYERFVPEAERPRRLGSSISATEILSLAGDANRGKKIFNKSSAANCKQCHAIAGFGGSLGPDLGNIGKKYERGALLETILDPSKAIAPEFIPYVLETTTGQVYAGFIVERTADHLLIKDVKSRDIRVEAAEIEALVPQKKSLMPELVLSEITAQDAADLLAFLITLK